MDSKKIGLVFVAGALGAVAATGATAKTFDTLSAIPAQQMSVEQMQAIEGKQHVYLLVESKGVELPAQGEAATRVAAPKPQNDGAGGSPTFRRSPSAEAPAFDAVLGR